MKNKFLTILITIVVGLGLVFLYTVLKNNKKDIPVTEEESLFPDLLPQEETENGSFGQGNTVDTTEETDSDGNIVTVTNPGEQTNEEQEGENELIDFERLVAKNVAGYKIFRKDIPKIVRTEIIENSNLLETYNFLNYPTMQLGFEGVEVIDLKIILNRFTENLNLNLTPVFDVETQTAILAFQSSNNLTNDGIVGRGTKTALNNLQGVTDEQEEEPEEENESITHIRYVDKPNGHVKEYRYERLSDHTISTDNFPVIHEAVFSPDGEKIVFRFLNRNNIIETILGELEDVESDEENKVIHQSLELNQLAKNITTLTMSPTDSKIFYIEEQNENTVDGYVYSLNNKTGSQVFESKFLGWLATWTSDDSITLTTKASAKADGFSYSLKTNGDFNKTIGSKKGLTINKNPSSTLALVNESTSKLFTTKILSFEENSFQDLSLNTISEKCVWSNDITLYCAVPKLIPDGTYPDDWYMGKTSFNDSIWKLDALTGHYERLGDLSKISGDKFDAVNLQFFENKLTFVNRLNGSLWIADMRELLGEGDTID